MKKILFLLAFTTSVIGFAPNFAYAGGASVRIIDGNGDTICSREFSGTKGMDSIIDSAAPCGFTYTLGWGDDYLDTINGVGWDGTNYWVLYVDNVYATQGVNSYSLDSINQILWAYSDGSKTSTWFAHNVGSMAGEGIVGLINPSTGGRVDLDGDGVADVDEYKNGTDPSVPDNASNTSSLASAFASIIYLDADGDGVSDLEERRLGTDPYDDKEEETKMRKAFFAVKSQIMNIIDLLDNL